MEGHLVDHILALQRLTGFIRLLGGNRQRLIDVNVLACVDRIDQDRHVQSIGGADVHSVDILAGQKRLIVVGGKFKTHARLGVLCQGEDWVAYADQLGLEGKVVIK